MVQAMSIRSFAIAGLSVVLSILAAPLHAEGDAAAGKNKTAMCAGCHGIPGFRTAYPETYRVPKLGGQNAGYIVNALKAYKAGERQHPTMKAIAASLTEQDMADLAAYYSGK
jgi:cytochrome c553